MFYEKHENENFVLFVEDHPPANGLKPLELWQVVPISSVNIPYNCQI